MHCAMQGATGKIPGQGTKVPRATEQLSLNAATTEPAPPEPVRHDQRARALQTDPT